MMRTALVALDGSPAAEAAVRLAIEWARRFHAELVGLGIVDEPAITRPEPVSIGATEFKRRRDDHRLADAHAHVLTFLARFSEACARDGVPCSLLEDVGTPHEQIVREAAGCDIVLLGRETNFHFETRTGHDETLERVLRRSPRPVVVVPRDPAEGEGVLVAYGGGREVARTLQAFTLLGLADGETMDVLTIDRERAHAERVLIMAEQYLGGRQIKYRLRPLVSDADPATLILEEIRQCRPRLLVMGAHGHHPFRDLFFTPVSRAVLNETPVPVFATA